MTDTSRHAIRLRRDDRLRDSLSKEWSAGVEVAIPVREITTRNGDTKAMPRRHQYADGSERDLIAHDRMRCHESRVAQ